MKLNKKMTVNDFLSLFDLSAYDDVYCVDKEHKATVFVRLEGESQTLRNTFKECHYVDSITFEAPHDLEISVRLMPLDDIL